MHSMQGKRSLPLGKAQCRGVCFLERHTAAEFAFRKEKRQPTITIHLDGATTQCLLRVADQHQDVGARLAGKQLQSCRPSLGEVHDSIHRAWPLCLCCEVEGCIAIIYTVAKPANKNRTQCEGCCWCCLMQGHCD